MSNSHSDSVGATHPPRDADAEPGEVLDLDTRFGLAAFGSERVDDASTVSPPPGPTAASSAAGPERIPPVPEPRTSARELASGPFPPNRNTIDPRPGATLESEPLGPVNDHGAGAVGAVQEWWPAGLRPAESLTPKPAHLGRWAVPATVAIVLLAILTGSIWAQRRASAAAPLTAGELTVDSTPVGARVIIGGKDRGVTPLSLALAPGVYELELRAGNERHVVAVRVKAGGTTSQHVILRQTAAAAPGTLRVTSEPPSAAVAVDGRGKGTTPVLITDLAPGSHEVVVTGTSGSVRQRVNVDAAATTTVMVPLPRPEPAQSTGGWLSITAPLELQVFEGGRLLGTTMVNPLMLPTGTHNLRLTDGAAGVDITRSVRIERGQTARLPISLPLGTLSINAVPWATVSVDGRAVGETPLGGVELSPGPHEVVFTHPDLGERRQQVMVRSGGATRLSVDLRR